MKKLIAIVLLAIGSVFVGHAIAPMVDTALQVTINPLSIAAPVFVLSSVNYFYNLNHPTTGKLYMAVTVETWVDYIIENIFKQNPHLAHCFNESDNVLGGAVVHIPQAGAKPIPVKNRASFPATIVTRTDTDITYPLDLYDVPPFLIKNAEQAELSYDKINSIMQEQLSAIQEIIGDDILYKWRAELAGNIVRTTGANVAAHTPNATLTRKLFTAKDLKAASTILNKQNRVRTERYALLDSELLSQLQDDPTLQQRDFAGELDMKNGVITRLWNFNILERSSTLIYDNTGTPVGKAIDATGVATDNASALCWQKNDVAMAQGDVNFFEDLSNPLYYGDMYSLNIRMGGRKRRANGEGVVAIVQAA